MNKRLWISDEAHRIAKAKAAAANKFLHDWLEELIRRATTADLGDPRTKQRSKTKRAG